MLVQDILLTGGGSATIQTMLKLFAQNYTFLEPIDPLADPTFFDQTYANELQKGPGNWVYDVTNNFFVSTSSVAPAPPRTASRHTISSEGEVPVNTIPRAYWADVAATMMWEGGSQSALYQVLATMFVTR